MADDTPATAPAQPAPTPVAAAPAVQPMPAVKPLPELAKELAAEPVAAVDRLRAFEDEKLGADAPRFQGKVERGVGSLFSRMLDADKAHHAKLEKLVDAEDKLAVAHTALIAAGAEHEAALKAVDDAPAGE